MNGRILMIGLLVFTALFGAGLWYAQVYAYYESTDGQNAVVMGAAAVPVDGYLGIDSITSPLKLRGCFTVDPAALASLPIAENPTPLSAPFWFDCYDHGQLQTDIDAGLATAYLAGVEERDTADRIVAVYPDGRAYEWRQLNAKYQD